MMVIQLGHRIIGIYLRDKRRSLVTAEGNPMTSQIESSSPIPLHYQIHKQLRQQIHSSALKPSDILPGEGRICLEMGVSRMTVSHRSVKETNP
jgi:hypothetical protein